MKLFNLKLSVILLVLIAGFSCKKNESDKYLETDFYYSKMEGSEGFYEKHFSIRKDKVIVKCNSESESQALTQQTVFSFAYETGNWVIGTIDPKNTKLDDLTNRSDVIDAIYGLEYVDGTLQYLTDQILVKFKDEQKPETVFAAIGLAENVEAIELFDAYSETYLITLNVKLNEILHICRSLFKEGLCEFAEPSFFREIVAD